MRKLIYYVACTVDGYIARANDTFDFFLPYGEHFADLIAAFPETFPAPARQPMGVDGPNQLFDTVLMGRNTYDIGAQAGLTSPYPHLTQYVVSRTMQESPDPAVQLITENPRDLVRQLKQQEGKHIWLCGGGVLAADVFDLIDEVILKINPMLLGAGKPLFTGAHRETPLELISSRSYPNGFVLAHYRLNHS